MQRKQIYLSEQQIRALTKLAGSMQENVSELIRQAVDCFLAEQEKELHDKKKRKAAFKKALHAAAGMWEDRDDIDFETMRARSNRRFAGWNNE